jgi:hypothetical protein
MSELDRLKNFPLDTASVQLWVFKKSSQDGAPTFKGRWVQTTSELDAAMKQAVLNERMRITEVHEYGLLAQTNESSALSISAVETHAGLVIAQAAAEVPTKKVSKLRDIQNTAFYAIKMIANGSVMYAVRKADDSWKTRRALNIISICFSDGHLGLASDPGFTISKHVDFFIVGDRLLISSKANFESVLSYKAAHIEDFRQLQVEDEFKSTFTSLNVLLDHIGENKIQLRRIAAIRQKGYYKDAIFMDNLRQNAELFRLSIQFDNHGRIIPTPESCRDIMQALLDHRLQSGFSNNIYDVQDASNVSS